MENNGFFGRKSLKCMKKSDSIDYSIMKLVQDEE